MNNRMAKPFAFELGVWGAFRAPQWGRGAKPLEARAFWTILEPREALKSTKFYKNLLEKMPKIIKISIAFADKDEMMMNNGSIFIFVLLNPLSRTKKYFLIL